MNFVGIVVREQFKNINLIFKLSSYDIKSKYQMHYLGTMWQFINPLIQVMIYWVIFGIGIRHGAPVNGTPYLLWLLCGLIPWFFIAPTVIQGSNSIYSKVTLVSKMKFPVSVLPTITIVGNFFSFTLMFAFLILLMFVYHVTLTFYFFQIIYYFICLGALIFAMTILFSTLTAMVRDFQLLIQSIMRMLLYVSPVLWNVSKAPQLEAILKLNPFFYVIQGIRDSLLSTGLFYEDMPYMIYFWSITLLILFLGSMLHVKFRDKFVDYL
jgi:teichoic acid transport system permease protein